MNTKLDRIAVIATRIAAVSLAFVLCGVGAKAQMQIAGAAPTPAAIPARADAGSADLQAIRSQLDTFAAFLNRGIGQKFNQPFSLLQDAKGIYLPGYGVAFHMEINLQTLRLMTPFDMAPYTPEEIAQARKVKIEHIRQLESNLRDLLLERGGTLTAMAPAQNIAIVVHIYRLSSESRDLPSQLLISVDRKALLDYQAKRLTAEQFQNASTMLEF